jgi:hypothetical protein
MAGLIFVVRQYHKASPGQILMQRLWRNRLKKSQVIGDRHVEEEVWIVHAVAQRTDVKVKLKTSVE